MNINTSTAKGYFFAGIAIVLWMLADFVENAIASIF